MSKKTPHLTAILTRAATRKRNTIPFKVSENLSSTAEYRPSSIPSFLSRLSTFKLSTYANKAPAVDAVAAAKCGWINDGKDRLICGICDISWVVAGKEGLGRDAGEKVGSNGFLILILRDSQCPGGETESFSGRDAQGGLPLENTPV